MIYRKLRTALAGMVLFAVSPLQHLPKWSSRRKTSTTTTCASTQAGITRTLPAISMAQRPQTMGPPSICKGTWDSPATPLFQARRTGSSQERTISTSPPLPSTSPARRYSIELHLSGADIQRWINHQQLARYPLRRSGLSVRHHPPQTGPSWHRITDGPVQHQPPKSMPPRR